MIYPSFVAYIYLPKIILDALRLKMIWITARYLRKIPHKMFDSMEEIA